jgi:hypothetical protein
MSSEEESSPDWSEDEKLDWNVEETLLDKSDAENSLDGSSEETSEEESNVISRRVINQAT